MKETRQTRPKQRLQSGAAAATASTDGGNDTTKGNEVADEHAAATGRTATATQGAPEVSSPTAAKRGEDNEEDHSDGKVGNDDSKLKLPESPSHPAAASATAAASPALRKAPQAPKRFKSSYICFFVAKQAEIKAELGENASVADVSRRSAELWKALSLADRQRWEEVAAKDKQRYMNEKAVYTGPWQVPFKRAKKDPSAPKRPMSAFLYFAQTRRAALKEKHPDLRNTDISRLLGELWRDASDDVRQPYIDHEKAERDRYKTAIAAWRREFDAKQARERRLLLEAPAAEANSNSFLMNMVHAANPGPYSSFLAYGTPHHQHSLLTPTTTGIYGRSLATSYGYPYSTMSPQPHAPPGAAPYAFPANAANHKPVVLGPNGMPLQGHVHNVVPPPAQVPQPHPLLMATGLASSAATTHPLLRAPLRAAVLGSGNVGDTAARGDEAVYRYGAGVSAEQIL